MTSTAHAHRTHRAPGHDVPGSASLASASRTSTPPPMQTAGGCGENGSAPTHIVGAIDIAKFSLLHIEVDDRHRALIEYAYQLGLTHGGCGK